MAKTLSNPSDLGGGGGFLKPRQYLTALALLVEPVSIRHNVPNTYKGRSVGERDVITADITVFSNQADLAPGAKPEVLKGVAIDKPGLTRPLEKIIGGAMMGIPALGMSDNGEFFKWDNVTDPEVAQAVTDYLERREAAVASAVEDAPAPWED